MMIRMNSQTPLSSDRTVLLFPSSNATEQPNRVKNHEKSQKLLCIFFPTRTPLSSSIFASRGEREGRRTNRATLPNGMTHKYSTSWLRDCVAVEINKLHSVLVHAISTISTDDSRHNRHTHAPPPSAWPRDGQLMVE